MPHKNLKLNEPTGDEVKTTTCYMCACRVGETLRLRRGAQERVRTPKAALSRAGGEG